MSKEPSLVASKGRADIGSRLRAARKERRIGIREMSREIDVSASMISQIELGRVMPSVKTLYAITSFLGLSLDDLFAQGDQTTAPEPPQAPSRQLPQRELDHGISRDPALVQRAGDRRTLTLASRVRWELLTPAPDPHVEFQEVTYEVGGESAPADGLLRHGGHEYGLILEGKLGVTVGFANYELEAGDSISFDSSIPHRLFNIADTPTKMIWVVVGRHSAGPLETGPIADVADATPAG